MKKTGVIAVGAALALSVGLFAACTGGTSSAEITADTDRASAILEVAKTQIADDAILRAAEKKFEQELSSAISKAAAAGCDLFGIKQRLYRYRYREYAAFQDSVLTAAQVHYDIRFTSLK